MDLIYLKFVLNDDAFEEFSNKNVYKRRDIVKFSFVDNIILKLEDLFKRSSQFIKKDLMREISAFQMPILSLFLF